MAAKKAGRKSSAQQFEGAKQSASQVQQFDKEQADAMAYGAETAEAFSESFDLDPELFDAQSALEDELQLTQPADTIRPYSAYDDEVGFDNIVGTAVGPNMVNGSFTGELAVKVYVREKVSTSRVGEGLVPESIQGMPTDVEEIGDVDPLGYRQRRRPARGGSSVGVATAGRPTGTIGCLCIRDGKLLLLSNNHVLADSNRARRGDSIIQPGAADFGRHPDDQIGILEDFVPLNFWGESRVDAALAFTSYQFVSPHHHTYRVNPNPLSIRQPMVDTVQKDGRTTGTTLGVVVGVNATIRVAFPGGVVTFRRQLQIGGQYGRRFSDEGDSGSLIVSYREKRPVGLLFAGSRNGAYTFANPIQDVISALRIRIIGEEE